MKKKIYLTIDDVPSKDFKRKIDFLKQNKIPALFFTIGKLAEKNKEDLFYAINNGFEIGNHSYSHKDFNKISLKKAKEEISKTDKIIDEIYKIANKKRKKKYFRFPYGNRGGKNKEKIQNLLSRLNYQKPLTKRINYSWYKEFGLDKGIDLLWTFDIREYDLPINEVIKRINNKNPKQGGDLNNSKSRDIILIHDHEKTTKEFFKIIKYLIKKGIKFEKLK
jgi:peptidoglycan-N-acetylglucosamine deacetylase